MADLQLTLLCEDKLYYSILETGKYQVLKHNNQVELLFVEVRSNITQAENFTFGQLSSGGISFILSSILNSAGKVLH